MDGRILLHRRRVRHLADPNPLLLTSIPLASLDHCSGWSRKSPGLSWGTARSSNATSTRTGCGRNCWRYLLIKDKFKFFNPLTIALLPFEHGDQMILNNYRDPKTVKDEGEFVRETMNGIELLKVRDTRSATSSGTTTRSSPRPSTGNTGSTRS